MANVDSSTLWIIIQSFRFPPWPCLRWFLGVRQEMGLQILWLLRPTPVLLWLLGSLQ